MSTTRLFVLSEQLFLRKDDHLREWQPVLVEIQNRYCKVLQLQLQLYRSRINKKKYIVLFLLPTSQQYIIILLLPAGYQYTATASSTTVVIYTASSSIEFYMDASFLR